MPPVFRPLMVAAALILANASALAGSAFPEGPFPQTLAFDIRRHGETIGTHVLVFRKSGSRIEADTDIRVKVTVFGLTAYRFEQRGQEVWEDGKLKSLAMEADDNGDKFKVAVEAVAGRLKAEVNGEKTEYAAMPPATLWRALPAKTTQALDPVDAKPTNVTVAELGPETVSVRGKPVQATHWRWDGELKRDLWYDSQGMLVQVYIKGDDGSDVYYILK